MAFGNPYRNRTTSFGAADDLVPRRAPSVRAKTVDGRSHIARVKALPCACCGQPGPSDAHHVREGQGGAQRAPDFLAIPLCKEHHQGRTGVPGDRSAMALRKLTELDMLALTIRALVAR